MARSYQTFLKRQKEQQRREKAELKRAARQARKLNPEGPMEGSTEEISEGEDRPAEGEGASGPEGR